MPAAPRSLLPAPRALIVPFTKMEGAGNDFVVLDNRFLKLSDAELGAFARRVCARRTGVGADGLLALDDAEPAMPDAHARMRYRNADGSLGTMCGNGARCLARFASRAGLGDDLAGGARRVVLHTDGGRVEALVAAPADAASGDVRLALGAPEAVGPAMLTDSATPPDFFRAWTGTQHAVAFVADAAAADLAALGQRVRRDAAFAPDGTNASVAEVVHAGGPDCPARVVARTYEKGVEAETLACGTGAVAVAAAARASGRVRADVVRVEMPGGVLEVGLGPDGATLAGPATTVFEGTLEGLG